MKKETKKILSIFLRYLIIVLVSMPNLTLFYTIFSFLTIYPVYFLLSLFFHTAITGNLITINTISIKLVEACIAGSAYFLLLLLNFSLPLETRKRIYSLLFSFAIFLAINILRIFIFSIMLVYSFKYFDITHLIFWYVLSGILVFLVWIITIKTFKIKGIPFYTDIKYIISKIKKG